GALHILLWCLLYTYSTSPLQVHPLCLTSSSSFFFPHTAPTEIYTLSLHDALPISCRSGFRRVRPVARVVLYSAAFSWGGPRPGRDRKSTRLNSSHVSISYAVFCLKKKKSAYTN